MSIVENKMKVPWVKEPQKAKQERASVRGLQGVDQWTAAKAWFEGCQPVRLRDWVCSDCREPENIIKKGIGDLPLVMKENSMMKKVELICKYLTKANNNNVMNGMKKEKLGSIRAEICFKGIALHHRRPYKCVCVCVCWFTSSSPLLLSCGPLGSLQRERVIYQGSHLSQFWEPTLLVLTQFRISACCFRLAKYSRVKVASGCHAHHLSPRYCLHYTVSSSMFLRSKKCIYVWILYNFVS